MPLSDFNGDGRSDILWRNANGTFSDWLGATGGGFTINDANAMASVDTNYLLIGVGDFNGDGYDDILYRYRYSTVSTSLKVMAGTETGGFTPLVGGTFVLWSQVLAIGDFDHDGRDDLIISSSLGAGANLSLWIASPSAHFASEGIFATLPADWRIAGAGDFDGDGTADLLWRNSVSGAVSDWLMTDNGFVINDANALAQVPTSWTIAGIGDFDGDGNDDILWRNSNGALSDWLGQDNGGFVINDANAFQMVPIDWVVAGIGDYDGDGNDDILWRNSVNGAVSDWLGQDNGGFVINDANAFHNVPLAWTVQPINGTVINWGLIEP